MLSTHLIIAAFLAAYTLFGAGTWGYIFLRTGWPNTRPLEISYKRGWSMVFGASFVLAVFAITAAVSFFFPKFGNALQAAFYTIPAAFIAGLLVFSARRVFLPKHKVRLGVPKRVVTAGIAARRAVGMLPSGIYLSPSQLRAAAMGTGVQEFEGAPKFGTGGINIESRETYAQRQAKPAQRMKAGHPEFGEIEGLSFPEENFPGMQSADEGMKGAGIPPEGEKKSVQRQGEDSQKAKEKEIGKIVPRRGLSEADLRFAAPPRPVVQGKNGFLEKLFRPKEPFAKKTQAGAGEEKFRQAEAKKIMEGLRGFRAEGQGEMIFKPGQKIKLAAEPLDRGRTIAEVEEAEREAEALEARIAEMQKALDAKMKAERAAAHLDKPPTEAAPPYKQPSEKGGAAWAAGRPKGIFGFLRPKEAAAVPAPPEKKAEIRKPLIAVETAESVRARKSGQEKQADIGWPAGTTPAAPAGQLHGKPAMPAQAAKPVAGKPVIEKMPVASGWPGQKAPETKPLFGIAWEGWKSLKPQPAAGPPATGTAKAPQGKKQEAGRIAAQRKPEEYIEMREEPSAEKLEQLKRRLAELDNAKAREPPRGGITAPKTAAMGEKLKMPEQPQPHRDSQKLTETILRALERNVTKRIRPISTEEQRRREVEASKAYIRENLRQEYVKEGITQTSVMRGTFDMMAGPKHTFEGAEKALPKSAVLLKQLLKEEGANA